MKEKKNKKRKGAGREGSQQKFKYALKHLEKLKNKR